MDAMDTGILLETGTNELEILEFHIDSDRGSQDEPERHSFGVNVAKVMEVIESPRLEVQPGASHPSFRGLIPLRSHILPVIDLAVWLGINKSPAPRDNVIVTEFSKSVTGFVVSGVTGIHRVGWPEVIPPDGYLPKTGIQAIIGLVERDGHFIQLLDLETIIADLSPDELDFSAPPKVLAPREIKAVVADDSATIRLMIQKTLERSGIAPTVVGNGQEALGILRELAARAQAEARPVSDFIDVLISDIEMPLMDGFSLTKHLKLDPRLKDVPVILYSSIITDELRHKGESVGATMQIAKPDLERLPEIAVELAAASDAKRSAANV
ncbi:two-component system, chemotaxis family, response regulator CheV [Humidesulfovibrio mexicanus]|uniref:Two-component system, chemotaxis family, response regulator CheV n=1 Tax=Humidesulfovibrio mexicanus TaxID=147047 RepID=A0A238Z5Y9_9BACT|nr:chemotaxis protein [Humidesulfovibrio mexicanus]SNR78806.1 two-component system, chemotaxis family, response regulator CheV [Humidesulfovibrio mexicanus]